MAAFDVADRNDMRVAAFDAGVSGQLWLLIDDLLASDSCAIRLGELLSDPFSLSLGTAQGRRLSVHLFNGIMAFLKGFLEVHSRGVGVWNSDVPRQVVHRASAQSPTPFGLVSTWSLLCSVVGVDLWVDCRTRRLPYKS